MNDTAPSPRIVGRMTIELLDNGSARPFPRVTFDPVGMFTPGLIEQYQMHFYQQIELAQAKVRASARASPPVVASDDTAPTTARRRAR
jgi:hypothetical protein